MVFLLLAVSEDDRAFLTNVWVSYHRLMYYQAYLVLRVPQAAEDAVGDAMVGLTRRVSKLRTLSPDMLCAYLVQSARNAAISIVRKSARRNEDGSDVLESVADDAFSIDERLLAREGVARVAQCIRRLPPQASQVMMMKYFMQLTDADIAAQLSMREVSVRSCLSRARHALADLLREEVGYES